MSKWRLRWWQSWTLRKNDWKEEGRLSGTWTELAQSYSIRFIILLWLQRQKSNWVSNVSQLAFMNLYVDTCCDKFLNCSAFFLLLLFTNSFIERWSSTHVFFLNYNKWPLSCANVMGKYCKTNTLLPFRKCDDCIQKFFVIYECSLLWANGSVTPVSYFPMLHMFFFWQAVWDI